MIEKDAGLLASVGTHAIIHPHTAIRSICVRYETSEGSFTIFWYSPRLG